MIPIALPYIYNVAASLEPLSSLPENRSAKLGKFFVPIIIAHNALDELAHKTLFSPYLRSSWPLSQELLELLKKYTAESDFDKEIPSWELWQIRNSYGQYKIALQAELGSLHSYFVTQKAGFDTYSLLMKGENLYPSDLARKVPQAIFDAREAAKCLAYENATAAGFHAFRALEWVLRKYYSYHTNGSASPKVRSIAVYAEALKKSGAGDQKVTFILKEIARLYRNPLIHPDAVLSVDEAVAIFGIVRSAITEMLLSLPEIQATTSTQVI